MLVVMQDGRNCQLNTTFRPLFAHTFSLFRPSCSQALTSSGHYSIHPLLPHALVRSAHLLSPSSAHAVTHPHPLTPLTPSPFESMTLSRPHTLTYQPITHSGTHTSSPHLRDLNPLQVNWFPVSHPLTTVSALEEGRYGR